MTNIVNVTKINENNISLMEYVYLYNECIMFKSFTLNDLIDFASV